MAIIVKNGKQVNNFLNVNNAEVSLEEKVTLLNSQGLLAPLKSWPTSKEMILYVINNFLSSMSLDKLNNMVDSSDEEEQGIFESDDEEKYEREVESNQSEDGVNDVESETGDDAFVGEDEYISLPDAIYDIDNCSEKVLAQLIRILNLRAKSIRKIRLMRQARLENEKINGEIEKVAVYNIVLTKFLPILNKQEIVNKVNIKTATKIFEDVCVEGYQEIPTEAGIESEIKKNKETQDFDIVAALNYSGVSVDRDDFGIYSIKNYNNGRGIKYFIGKSEKAFAMSKTSAQRFIDEFLNKPIEKRKFMTPGQVFITYINEAEKSLGINSKSSGELGGLFGSMNSSKSAKQYFKDIIKKYSRNSEEWKDFQRVFEGEYYTNKEHKDDSTGKMLVRQQAKRLVIGETFEDLINYGQILSSEQISINDYRISDISRDFGLEFDLESYDVDRVKIEYLQDQTFRIVNSMHTTLQQMRAFIQDIVDNFTVDYLRKEKIFLLQQEDQNEYISKKKEYESLIKKLSYDKDKDSTAKMAYYQAQVDELTQKIGDRDYLEAKNTLLKSKNNFRILLLNAKCQKEKVAIAINEGREKARREYKPFTIDDILEIIRNTLTVAPELIVTFDKGRATSWVKHSINEQAEKKNEPLSEIDKIIETTAAKISDESHQKILQENLIREKMKKTQKEERLKSVNAYINAYGSIVGNAMGVGAYTGIPATTGTPGPTFAPQVGMGMVGNNNVASPRNIARLNSPVPMFGEGMSQPIPSGTIDPMTDYNTKRVVGRSLKQSSGVYTSAPSTTTLTSSPTSVPNTSTFVAPATPVVQAPPAYVPPTPVVAPQQPMYAPPIQQPIYAQPEIPKGQPNYHKDYEDFDEISENIEPCVIPYIVAYDNRGTTVYGNMLERYATFDRYKYLLTTNNNALYTYVENKQAQIQTSEQIISDLHIRYLKNAMAKSGQSTQDSNMEKFDYKADVRRFLGQYVPQNLIDMIISDYKEMLDTIDLPLMKDLIEHKFKGDLEEYIPEDIKNDALKGATIIASVVKAIMTDPQVQKTYDAYSSKMKQTYVTTLVGKIDSNSMPSAKLSAEESHARLIDYLSFSIKAQNVIIQSQDSKDNGLATYPRSIFFKQKDNADQALKKGKILSFEQNEIITTRTSNTLSEMGNDVQNLFGTLYNFNGSYNKLMLKLKPFTLNSSVKFMENLIDALNEKLNMKITVIEEEKKKKNVTLVKFASKEKEKELSMEEKTYNFEDNDWFVRKGFVLDKNKVREFYTKVAFGFKYALEKDKKSLQNDFYENNILSLAKINEKFKDFPTHIVSMITAVIRDIMMSKCERIIDFIDYINTGNEMNTNKALYINRMIMESRTFDKKNDDEKLETIVALGNDFITKADDMVSPHPEIYSTTSDIEKYENLYLYYALNDLYAKLGADNRFITTELTVYFEEMKKKFRTNLLEMIRDEIPMNGYEQDLAKHFELKLDNMQEIEYVEQKQEDEQVEKKSVAKIKNIDVIFKGILDGFNKALADETSEVVIEQMQDVKEVLAEPSYELSVVMLYLSSIMQELIFEVMAMNNLEIRMDQNTLLEKDTLKRVAELNNLIIEMKSRKDIKNGKEVQ